MPPGQFFVFEGPNSVGKSTLVRATSVELSNRKIRHVTCKLPSDGPIGTLCRTYARNAKSPQILACLLAAEFYRAINEEILPHVVAGTTVLCDRYIISSFVYQGLQGIPSRFLTAMFEDLPRPELTFVLRATAKTILERRPGSDDQFDDPSKISAEVLGYEQAVSLFTEQGFRLELIDSQASIADNVQFVLSKMGYY